MTRTSLLAVMLSIAATCGVAHAEPLPSVPLPAELDRVLRDYERLWVANDPAGLAQLFAPEGMALPNGRPPARGAERIREAYSTGAGVPLSLRALAYSVSGDLAYIVGAYGPEPGKPDFGKFVLVLRRGDDGRWRLLVDIDNVSVPLPPPPSVAQAGLPSG